MTGSMRRRRQTWPWASLPPVRSVPVGSVQLGGAGPLGVIAGPCVLEDLESAVRTAAEVQRITERLGLPLVFKSSFDKANRTSHRSYRGPGLERGLHMLSRIRETLRLPVTTDIHEPGQAAVAAEVVDLLQVPAFLCRQTDLLTACARTGKPVSVKKGQFLSPWDTSHIVNKLEAAGAQGILLVERGAAFGYHDLVVDMRSIPIMQSTGWPVVFDGTHSVQRPGSLDGASGGRREFIPSLVRAALAAGADVLFLEVHENPDAAPCDGPNMVPLHALEHLLTQARRIHEAVHADLEVDRPSPPGNAGR